MDPGLFLFSYFFFFFFFFLPSHFIGRDYHSQTAFLFYSKSVGCFCFYFGFLQASSGGI